MSGFNPSRRHFLRTTGVAGGGLALGFGLSGCSGTVPLPEAQAPGSFVPNALIQITPDNLIRFFCPRDEMGQGVTTGLATLVAEELDVEPHRLAIDLGGVHPEYANPEFGIQGTGGSTSIKAHWLPLREAAATVREVILTAAAIDLGVARSELETDNGEVLAQGQRYPYGQFVSTAAEIDLPETVSLKAAGSFKYIGTDFPRLDGVDKATGTGTFGLDVDLPGLHYAVVVRSPVAGGSVASFDARAAEAMPGVVSVAEIPTGTSEVGSGVVVVAERFWQAKQAAAAVEVEWQLPALAGVSTPQIRADYETALANEAGSSKEDEGDVASGFETASAVVEHQYWTPYLAHAPMEPVNAVVRLGDDEAELWSGTQFPPVARGIIARLTGIDAERVTVHNTYLGGAFGRRGTLSHIAEATEAARVSGKAVKLVWTREDDLKSGVYRPASLMGMKAGVDSDGRITAWQAKRVGGNITPDVLKAALPGALTALPEGVINGMVGLADRAVSGWFVDPSSTEGLFEDYDLPNRDVRHVTVDHGLPLTYWRSVGHSFTAFAKESIVDELAAAAGLDAVELRLKNTANNPRLRRVIEVAREQMQARTVPAGHALGFAAHGSFSSYVAEVAEVSIENGSIRVHHVTCVVDCGVVVNPDIVRAQMEGAVAFGLTAALHGKVELENGEVVASNFHNYPILRMNEAPAIDVVLIDSDEAPTGVGEPGLPPVAPAVANAVAALTGQRLRSLPLELA
ncbi:MAG: molybdopterin cofactor-binding domain-containing protein [Pseudomonadota bacterium]